MTFERRRPPWRWLVQLGVTQPIDRPVPADDAHFLASKGPLRIAQRVLKQRIELAFSGQRAWRRDRIEPGWKRAVWLHTEDPQIGDALMDLAPRSLLAERGIALDLLAPAAVAALFEGDHAFRRVVADEAFVRGADYDFAIVDSDSWQALAAKRRRAPKLPWVSIRGAYLGYDFQRGLLATRRLAALLGVRLDDTAEARHAGQKLLIGGLIGLDGTDAQTARAWDDTSPCSVVIALGGVQAERSYRRWTEVARRLAESRACIFTLLGSANARGDRDAFVAAAASPSPSPLRLIDRVEQTSLQDAARTMAGADLVLCADGGLMHLALTTATPVVALFDASVDPAWRLPAHRRGRAVRASTRDVNAIDPGHVAEAALAEVGMDAGVIAGPTRRLSRPFMIVPMKSPKLIIVLVVFGLFFLVTGLTRTDLSNHAGVDLVPASLLASSVLVAIGVGLLAVGGVLLRRAYLDARRRAPASTPAGRNTMIGVAVVIVCLIVAFAVVALQHGH